MIINITRDIKNNFGHEIVFKLKILRLLIFFSNRLEDRPLAKVDGVALIFLAADIDRLLRALEVKNMDFVKCIIRMGHYVKHIFIKIGLCKQYDSNGST
jgi:hypothetical protein